MNETLSQRPRCAKEKACTQGLPPGGSTAVYASLSALCEGFPEFAWLGERLLDVGITRLTAARAVVELGGYDPSSPEVAAALGLAHARTAPSSGSPAPSPSFAQGDEERLLESAAERARAGAGRERGLERADEGRPLVEPGVEPVVEARLAVARGMVEAGFDPAGPEVAEALGLGAEAQRAKAVAADVARRSRRRKGTAPPGKPLEARRAHVAVRILLAFVGRLFAPTPTLPDGTRVNAAAGAMLAKAGLITSPEGDELEPHPRSKPRALEAVTPATAQRLAIELEGLARGEYSTPDEADRELPPGLVCGATLRNRRRRNDARAQYAEQQRYARIQRLERLAGQAGHRLMNPAGEKRLPLHEGRKARAIAWDRRAATQFLLGLPRVLQARLYQAGTLWGRRGRYSQPAMLVYAYYAFILWQAEAPRPTMRRDGFDRAIEGLNREALAVAFVWNPHTREPYHPNTLSSLVDLLERAGLVGRETPNSQADAYKGTTGWALTVYRVRNAEQLGELLRALGISLGDPSRAETPSAEVAEPPS